MANDRLREALARSDLTTADLAVKLEVDPKTIERWVTRGRNPRERHRQRLAELLCESEGYLWPTALSPIRRSQAAESEIVHVYPHRASVPADVWRRLIGEAEQNIDLLMYSGMFLIDENPMLTSMLQQRADAGVRVRILLGDPASDGVRDRGSEEGIDDALAAKIRSVMVRYRELNGVAGIEVRLHGTTLYNSIYRFDDQMLINSHVYGFPAAHAPVLHLRRLNAGILFETYAESYKQVWTAAKPAWGRPRAKKAGTRG